MHYLIYVPHQHVEAAEKRDPTVAGVLKYVGLSDHAAGAFNLQVGNGPDGQGGMLYSWLAGTAQHRMHYRADEQDWIPAASDPVTEEVAARYWLGFWKDSPVTARDIQRHRTVPGHEISIGDTGGWVVPDAKHLPCTIGVNSAGQWVPEVDERYAEYDSAVKTLRNMVLTDANDLGNDRLFNFCLQSLQVNYRLTREVVGHLKIFTTETTVEIASLAIGLTASMEA